MKMRFVVFYVLCFAFSILIGCDKLNFFSPKKNKKAKETFAASVVKGTLIAKVNSLTITLEELNREIDVFNASIDLRQDLPADSKKSLKIDTRDKKINYLKEEMVRRMVFYQAALDRGLDRKDDVTAILERSRIAILASEMQNEVIKNIEVSSAEIEEAYKAIKDQLKKPETRRIREIVTKTEDEARQAVIELYQQGSDFASVARNRSIAESAKNGGDLGSIQKGARGERFASFDEVAFSSSLKQGAVSGIFQGPDGFCVVKIEEIKGGQQTSLSEVWDELKYRLTLRKQQEELDKAYAKLSEAAKVKIEIHEGEVK